MEKINFCERIEEIIRKDPRYDRDAYQFVREALDFTLKMVRAKGKQRTRHVTGQELLEGLRQYGLQQFGPMTKTVLNYWGIQRCEDFADIVFNMVDAGILGKTEQDSRDDFKGGYDFDEAFVKPYQPHARPVNRATASARPAGSSPSRTANKQKLSSGPV
ncbi:MAG: hypothetical protein NZ483_04680 [Verrucomicrobiae bacterium]|nr:hypothetical protein [Verrucomicrobiae bacterium]MDW8343607.1 hypothetical protein [Verrucomicrobiae bacterium]